jgi:hypothetical protein
VLHEADLFFSRRHFSVAVTTRNARKWRLSHAKKAVVDHHLAERDILNAGVSLWIHGSAKVREDHNNVHASNQINLLLAD